MLIDPGFVSEPMAALFSPDARVARLLQFEAALARVQARLGIIPGASASAIERACARTLDGESLLRRGWELGSPLLGLLALLRQDLPPEHAAHLHYGATTQDAVDTASALELQAGLGVLARQSAGVARALRDLAASHRATPILARTLLQGARPTRFGLTAARWLTPFIAASEEIGRAREELPLQLGGAVGSLDGLAGRGIDLSVALAEELGLRAPILPWHADRTPIVRAVHAVALTVRAALKVANDLVLLAQDGLGEVRMRPGGSSRMAHKQNPIDAVRAIAAGEAAQRLCAGASAGRTHELERAAGAWQMEWLFVPLIFYTSGATLEALQVALDTLEVDEVRMRQRAGEAADDDAAEALIERSLAAAEAHWGEE